MFSIKAAALLSLISFIKMSSIATLNGGRLEVEHIVGISNGMGTRNPIFVYTKSAEKLV